VRLLICAGGTGGGVYPALSIVQAFGIDSGSLLWVGSQDGMEKDLVEHAGLPFISIPAAGVHGVGIVHMPGNIRQILKGISASRRILKDFLPDAILFTGGYVAVPMAYAGRRIPALLYVPDIEPGLAIKAISRFARIIALTVAESSQYFRLKSKLHVTGYPTRTGLMTWDKPSALEHFKLSRNKPVLLVLGGSKGARSINRAIVSILPELLPAIQVIHISGMLDHPEIAEVASQLPQAFQADYHLFPYLHDDIGAALKAANLVVSRSGASILGEYPLFGLPSVLVPYPYAWRYQKVNADYLVSRNAAVLLKNEDLERNLLPTLKDLLGNPSRLQAMQNAVQELATPNAAKEIAFLLQSLANEGAISNG